MTTTQAAPNTPAAPRMEEREVKGVMIAKAKQIKAKPGGIFLVPSATHNGTYVVETAEAATCTCPDFELRHLPCKHIYAVTWARRIETMPDGSVKTTETIKITYKQNWPAYNAAQREEKERAAVLLRGLCDGIVQPPQTKGRPRLSLGDMVFAATMKVFNGDSARRSDTDMREFAAKGLISKAPCPNSVLGYIENPALTPILMKLIEESAAPLAAIERDFAVDSTGFSTCHYIRWFDEKYGKERSEHDWIKAHLMVGVSTHIVTSARITDRDGNDCPEFKPLVEKTMERFTPRDVSADKAYLSHANLALVASKGGVPYIPFKTNTTGEGPELWQRMFHLFSFSRSEFVKHYNKRSNVESVNSAIKRKFGATIRARDFIPQVNELLCKILCYNLSVLVHAIHELGLEPTFWADNRTAA
jgi:transposase